jgi:cell division protein FtsW
MMKRDRAASRKLPRKPGAKAASRDERQAERAARAERSRAGLAREDASVAALGISVLLLAGIGAVAVFSATAPLALDRPLPPHFLRHALATLVGGGVVLVAARIPIAAWHRMALPLWGVSLVLLGATLAVGLAGGGATRWLSVPGLGFAFQPVELAKLATVLAVAALLGRRDGRVAGVGRERLAVALTLGAAPAALAVLQPDLGNAVILLGLAVLLLFVAGADLRPLLAVGTLGGILVGVYTALRPYALRRVLGFLDPWSRASAEGFQLVQSFVAFGRGGIAGVGIGDGRQKLYYLPEAHTDFILSVVAEETGLIGVLIVLGGFAALLVAGVRIALAAKQRFPLLLAFGMTALLTVPALLNAAVVMGCLPTKGLTLPFLSYGRSSLVVSCLAVGILFSVARANRAPRGASA